MTNFAEPEPSKHLSSDNARAAAITAAQTRARVRDLSLKLLDGLERVLDGLTAATAIPSPPVDVARRQLANTLRLPHACANRRCRRTCRCQGEPLHCLQAALPILPAEAFDGLLRKQPSRSRKRAQRRP